MTTPRLKETYKNEVFRQLMEKFNYNNVMEVPQLEKITINMGLGEAKDNAKMMEKAIAELALISGQKPARFGPATTSSGTTSSTPFPWWMTTATLSRSSFARTT